MLSYQHGYHAGNHADVIKHAVLCLVLSYLIRKDKPLLFFDTHAGRGLYPLGDAMSGKTGEYRDGIGRLWALPPGCEALDPYLDVVRSFNGSELRRYPGSSLIAQRMLRPTDRLVACELHPQEYAGLVRSTKPLENLRIHKRDGFKELIAALPPRERRGVVLIDPSYEQRSEDGAVVKSLESALARFANGVYLVWYPVVEIDRARWLVRKLVGLARTASASGSALQVELHLEAPAPEPGRMNASGVLVVNPPWTLAQQLEASVGDWVSLLEVAPGAGRLTCELHARA